MSGSGSAMTFGSIVSRWDRFKDNFDLFAGVIGLVADTITILGAIGAGMILPSVTGINMVKPALDTLILITAIVGLYSLTMIVWFLFRQRRSRQETKTFGFDDLYSAIDPSSPVANLIFVLFPVFGPFFSMMSLQSVRVIFWLAVFIAFLPTTLWSYLLSAQVGIGCGIGLLGSFLLSQYATFFALVLDKFFESKTL